MFCVYTYIFVCILFNLILLESSLLPHHLVIPTLFPQRRRFPLPSFRCLLLSCRCLSQVMPLISLQQRLWRRGSPPMRRLLRYGCCCPLIGGCTQRLRCQCFHVCTSKARTVALVKQSGTCCSCVEGPDSIAGRFCRFCRCVYVLKHSRSRLCCLTRLRLLRLEAQQAVSICTFVPVKQVQLSTSRSFHVASAALYAADAALNTFVAVSYLLFKALLFKFFKSEASTCAPAAAEAACVGVCVCVCKAL